MFAARTLAIALLGIFGLTNPPKMTGCCYCFSAFWVCNIVAQLCDAVGYNWYSSGSLEYLVQLQAFIPLILTALNCFALHQTWEVAYPGKEELR